MSRNEGARGYPDETVLEVDGLRKEFGGLVALDGVNLSVTDDNIVGIIGPNGAGKSTLFNCIMGFYEVTDGRVFLNKKEITSLGTSDIVNSGVSRTFQEPRVFPDLTIRENMLIHQDHQRESLLRTLVKKSDTEVEQRTEELLEFVDLLEKADTKADEISTGQKKLLNIASALVSDPDIVLLDEPAAGVNPGLIDDIVDSIQTLNDRGTTFLIIEHNMGVIRDLSDTLHVLANGTNLTQGDPANVLSKDEVLDVYFGE